jgi:hypothetical protein
LVGFLYPPLPNATAFEAETSPKMIFAHYRELCTEAEAREWFGLRPTREEMRNVIKMVS